MCRAKNAAEKMSSLRGRKKLFVTLRRKRERASGIFRLAQYTRWQILKWKLICLCTENCTLFVHIRKIKTPKLSSEKENERYRDKSLTSGYFNGSILFGRITFHRKIYTTSHEIRALDSCTILFVATKEQYRYEKIISFLKEDSWG
jgi:hypothetical protein